MNEFVMDEEDPMELLKIDAEVEKKQVHKLKVLREERDTANAESKIAALRQGIKDNINLMPALMECAHAYCTIGEIAQVLREEYGEYHDPGIF